MSSFEQFVCCDITDITLSLDPLLESLFSTRYAKPPFELPRRLCFEAAVDETFSFSLRCSSFVKSLVDFLCFNETTLSLHVLSSVVCELCRAYREFLFSLRNWKEKKIMKKHNEKRKKSFLLENFSQKSKFHQFHAMKGKFERFDIFYQNFQILLM